MTRIPFLRPTFPPVEEIAEDYAAILERGMFSNRGPFDRQLTIEIERWIGGGVRASTVSSCTAGIELAVRATFCPGRPLAIVPSFTFAASSLVLHNCGYAPAFVDVDRVTWQPKVIEAAAFLDEHHTEVGGILLTATFGVTDAAVAEWEQIAAQYELPLVIDAAAGFGSLDPSGNPAGARGTCEVFSMHATKLFSVGEGGVVTSRDLELIDRIDRMKNFGFDNTRRSVGPGTNGKLAELSAAIGLRQLAALPGRLALRRQVTHRYIGALQPLGLTFQPGVEVSAPPFASALLPSAVSRRTVRIALEHADIESRDYYNPPVHQQPFFARALRCGPLSTTTDFAQRILSLPMADDLDVSAVARVAQIVGEALNG